MTIYVEELRFKAIIGILDFEREKPQDIIVNLTLDYEYEDEFINYVDLVDIIKTDIKKSKFLLIEDAITSIFKKIQSKFPHAKNINLKITKPSILSDCKVSVSSSEIFNP